MQGYIAFDIETTGLNPEKHQILSVAAVADNEPDIPIDKLPYFHMSVLYDVDIVGQPIALAMNAKLLEIIGKGGLPSERGRNHTGHMTLEQVMFHYMTWLGQFAPDGEKIVYAGKNLAAFDFGFLSHKNFWPQKYLRSGHRVLDVGPMYYNFSDYRNGTAPNLVKCMERVKVVNPVTHDALQDCRDVVLCIRKRLHS